MTVKFSFGGMCHFDRACLLETVTWNGRSVQESNGSPSFGCKPTTRTMVKKTLYFDDMNATPELPNNLLRLSTGAFEP
jgi:hypothetical protein